MVIPVHDVNPVRRTAWITYGLIAINVIVLVLMPVLRVSVGTRPALGALCRQEAFYDRYAAIPKEMINNQQLRLAATGRPGPRPDSCVMARPGYHKIPALSVLLSMFLHAGWLHLLGNMLFLAVFGNNVEDRLGRVGYLAFYLACGYAAAYGYAALHPASATPLVGASGAIAGVLGAYLVLYPRARVWSLVPFLLFLPLRIPAWLVLGLWFLLQWAYTAGYAAAGAGSVAYQAHLVGFALGAILGLIIRAAGPPARTSAPAPRR
ncbi:MAG TPA: rhomboid family intramembrane serine protease [Streptosporangiaceae bacterium]|nr:rhomboid family intramembrane serine protease [Streptosporangiaceae bacterium]